MKLPKKSSSSTSSSSRSEISAKWLKEDRANQYIYVLLSVLTLGILPMICYFYPNWKVELRSSACKAEVSEYVLLKIENSSEYLIKVTHYKCQLTEEHLISLELNGIRYCASSYDNYSLLPVPEVPINFLRFLVPQSIVHRKEILSEERKILFALYGPNSMNLPEANGLEIFIRHAFSPFYLFQYFAATVWLIEDYVLYSILILLITISAVIVTTQESLYNLERLRNLAGHESDVDILQIPDNAASMTAIYDPSYKVKSQDTMLIPGDQFIVTPGMSVPCDAILVTGRVVVDESMLTGESIPANKSPIEISGIEGDATVLKRGSLYNSQAPQSTTTVDTAGKIFTTDIATKRAGNVLFSGTKVRACHGGTCIAVCYRTGFRSAKGQLVASLLHPKDGFMNFISDALVVIFCMLILSTLLYIVVAIELASMGVSGNIIILRYFDAITIAVPPALTACLTVATAISISRLKLKDIFVSDTTRVNWAGSISAVCFDKTGTLTEDRLNFTGAYLSSLSDAGGYMLKDHGTKAKDLPRICLEIMATCHSLAILDITASTFEEPVGDPLELELVRASGWRLSVNDDRNHKSYNRMRAQTPLSASPNEGYNEIIRHFEFTPDRLRAATLLKRPNGGLVYLVKGSPEIIESLCDPSTIPLDLKSSLTILSKKGLRVIAIAYRECYEAEDMLMSSSQHQIEAYGGIVFLGLLTLSSPLKQQTKSTIDQLNRADIHVNMITGDYIHTAIAVAMDCGILAQSSLTQNTLYIIDERESDGATIIIDAANDEICNPRVISLEKLLDIASLTSTLPPANINDPTFSMKQQTQQDTSSSATMNLVPNEGQLQLAVTGRGLLSVKRNFKPTTFNALVRYAKVFARTKPADKKSVVDELLVTKEIDDRLLMLLKDAKSQSTLNNTESTPLLSSSSMVAENSTIKKSDEYDELMKISTERGYHAVLFCGDGANDMSALRAATVGVSLCDTETSVAAPITSRMQTPGSVIDTIIEGRCSLITAYVLVLFNIMYGVIQLIMAIMLYSYGLVAGDYMYLTQDLFYTLVLGLAIAMTPPSEFFSKSIPPKRFITTYLMTKLIPQLVIFVCFQLLALYVLSLQGFYTRYETDDPLSSTYSYEATTIDTMCLAQLMIASVVSTIGEPFRKPWYTNRYHVIALTCQLGWLLFQTFGDSNAFSEDILDLEPLPVYFGFILLSLMVGNAMISWIANSYAESIRPNPYSEKLHLLGKIKSKLASVNDKPTSTALKDIL